MVDLAPLRGVRFDPEQVGRLDDVVAGPYDDLTPEDEERLRAGHPRSVVHLMLPPPRPDGGGRDYARAAATLRRWMDDGVLVRDPEPSFYLLEQRWTDAGAAHVRRGLMARVRSVPYDATTVRAHEFTHPAAVADRLEHLATCGLQDSPLFLLYQDESGRIAELLEPSWQGEPIAEVASWRGVRCTVRRIADATVATALTAAFGERWLLIADGHHRYEAALEHAGRAGASRPDAAFTFAYCCALDDPGLRMLPTHRLVLGGAHPPVDELVARISSRLELVPMGESGAAGPLVDALGRRLPDGRSPRFAMIADGASRSWLAYSPLGSEPAGLVEDLDVSIVDGTVFDEALGRSARELAGAGCLRYTPEADVAWASTRSGAAHLALLMRPPTLDQLLAVTEAGLRMPPKSTFFHPKLPSGLMLNVFR